MEMRFTLVAALAAGGLLAASAGTRAEERCFAGGDGRGTLEFSGAVEGSGFTGRFGEFSVTYCLVDGNPLAGKIEVAVELASADTDNRERDEALKGEEFLAVEQYPRAAWSSRAIERDDGEYVADGELELKGIRAAQTIRFTLEPDGETLLARGAFTMAGGAEVDRQRFEVGTGEFADPEFVRNRVDVSFEVLLTSGQ